MQPRLPSRLALVAVACALFSAGIWGWSRRLPEPNWESSTATAVLSAVPEPTPVVEVAAAAVPEPTPLPESTPVPSLAETVPIAPAPSPEAEASPVVAAATPERPRPSDAELAGPLPTRSPEEKTAVATPALAAPISEAQAPAKLDIRDIARQPEIWPRQVLLISTQRFPVIINGVNVGSVQVPAGRPVILRKIHADGTLEIEFQGSPAKVKAQATDLVARATVAASARAKAGQP